MPRIEVIDEKEQPRVLDVCRACLYELRTNQQVLQDDLPHPDYNLIEADCAVCGDFIVEACDG